ncbi:Uma2 family endonuclease [Zavarzinia sp. CC-PAN008]|uniref:Uma2 family endonuclease n=1 Tax=Zavarzinia sp. CC-PAN008 TaxID=3243332 RepID=UPI003F749977
MSSVRRPRRITFAEFLAAEAASPVRHEFVNGEVFAKLDGIGDAHAMAGASLRHNIIVSNLVGVLRQALRGKGCQVLSSDMLVRIEADTVDAAYYPDIVVRCGAVDDYAARYLTSPALLVEVASESTERLDRTEKRDAYLKLPSLRYYLLVEQASRSVTLMRRQVIGFDSLLAEGAEAVSLPDLGITLSLDEIYADAGLPTESDAR